MDMNVNTKDTDGKLALHKATRDGNIKIVIWLVDNTAVDIQATDNRGRTCLHDAAWWDADNQLEVVKWLVGVKGMDVNAKDHDGDTVFHHAVRRAVDSAKTVRWLAEAGNADVDVVNTAGNSPRNIARQKKNLVMSPDDLKYFRRFTEYGVARHAIKVFSCFLI
jgi:ankyrin repeat protein